MEQRAIPFEDYGLAEEDTSWDGPAEIKASDVETLRKISTWVDVENDESKAAYKLPHHRAGDLKAVWKGVSAAMSALLGSRGGVNIPSSDRKGVYTHLRKHYQQFGKEVPDFRDLTTYDVERRTINAELRAADGSDGVITGYAALFNTYSQDLGGFREKIQPGAFATTIKESDVRALINHDPNFLLGRTKNKTLKLWEDERGLGFECQLPDTTYARDLMVSMKRKDISQCSFGFQVIQDKWSGDGTRRTLERVKLFDVSPVTFPAYTQTSVKLRSFLNEVGIDVGTFNQILQKDQITKEDRYIFEEIVNYFNSIDKQEESEGSKDALVLTMRAKEIELNRNMNGGLYD